MTTIINPQIAAKLPIIAPTVRQALTELGLTADLSDSERTFAIVNALGFMNIKISIEPDPVTGGRQVRVEAA